MNVWSQIVVVLATMAGGQAGASVISWFLSRKGEKSKAAREQKVDEAMVKKSEVDRTNLLAEAQQTAQQTALESVAEVRREYQECREELRGLRDICGSMIDAFEALMIEDTPRTRADGRAVIRLARRAM